MRFSLWIVSQQWANGFSSQLRVLAVISSSQSHSARFHWTERPAVCCMRHGAFHWVGPTWTIHREHRPNIEKCASYIGDRRCFRLRLMVSSVNYRAKQCQGYFRAQRGSSQGPNTVGQVPGRKKYATHAYKQAMQHVPVDENGILRGLAYIPLPGFLRKHGLPQSASQCYEKSAYGKRDLTPAGESERVNGALPKNHSAPTSFRYDLIRRDHSNHLEIVHF